jgi:hypothetical protein
VETKMSENRQANARKVHTRNFNYNWIGTSRCTICSEYTSVVNVVDAGTRVCGRCDSDLYKATGQLEKERWIKTGRR